MDHWGHDPWADDADADAELPKQIEVASTTKPAFAAAPALLNTFLDDAQWGTNDDEFGAWETAATDADLAHTTPSHAPASVPSPTLSATTKLPDAEQLGNGEEKGKLQLEDGGWDGPAHTEEDVKEGDNVVSETSDSATTIQPDDDHERVSTDFPDDPHLDEELSTRPSTSPSDVSHTEEPPPESPRTSFEDERIAGAATEAATPINPDEEKAEPNVEHSYSHLEVIDNEETEDVIREGIEADTRDRGNSQEGKEDPAPQPSPSAIQVPPAVRDDAVQATEPESASTAAEPPPRLTPFKLDLSEMDQLFPPTKPWKEPAETPDEPISSTSTRKAWYRLTRKQTMREYNVGQDDDNYVRVTWSNSHIRSEVGTIVSRWTMENRMSGRGHSASLSFYWDQTPAPAPPTQLRKKPTIPNSVPIHPAKQNVKSISTNVPAAFDWSSPPMANDPWRQDSPGTRSITSPIAARISATPEPQALASRSVSVDLTPRTPVIVNSQEAPTVDSPKADPRLGPSQESAVESDPWISLGQIDTNLQAKVTDTTMDDDDEEWGEMVESPAVSTKTPVAVGGSPNSSRSHTPSTPQQPAKPSPLSTPVSRHASPIVRLKGTVSPTSSAFRANSFIPISSVVEPIGPGLLKRATTTKAADAAIAKSVPTSIPTSPISDAPKTEAQKPTLQTGELDEFAIFESSIPQPELAAIPSPTVSTAASTHTPEPIGLVNVEIPPIVAPNGALTPVSVPHPPTFTELPHTIAPLPQTPTDPWFDTSTTPFVTQVAPPQTPTDPWFDTSSTSNPPATTPTVTQDFWSSSTPAQPPAPQDSWSNADFSFFESAPPPAPPPAATQTYNPLSPSDPWAVFNAPVSSMPKIAPGTLSNSEQRKREEEAAIIAEIVRGLPDLGYLLR